MKSLIHNFFAKKLVFSLFILASLYFLLATSYPVFAFDPSVPNNKFGIHLAVPDTEDIKKAAELVNSSGGSWGYVTLVIQENDQDKKKWQEVFDNLRKLKVIPIIRLATEPVGDNWRRPNRQDAESWANFLNSLNWVVKDRYIVLFNEPNHGREWGDETDPENYAETVLEFAKKLKEKSPDFFLMLSGFDASAPQQPPLFMDEEIFLSAIKNAKPELFEEGLISGISSHSYPHPDYIGSAYDFGRGTVRTYQWEIDIFRQLFQRDLPVFITETGWKQGILSSDEVAENVRIAFEQVWLPDDRVRAVTPFILNYQTEPFTQFSWKKQKDDEFYPHFYKSKQILKEAGDPERIEKGRLFYDLPKELLIDSNYHFSINLTNLGQGYWDKDQDYYLKLLDSPFKNFFFSEIAEVSPNSEGEVDLFLKTTNKEGKKKTRVEFYRDDKKILEGPKWEFNLLPLPQLIFNLDLFPKIKDEGDEFEIQIFDKNEQIVFKKKGVKVHVGKGKVDNVRNIYLGGRYRIVVLNSYYLPRQTHLIFNKSKNEITFESMLPMDFDKDGKFDWRDFAALLKNPKLISLFLP